MSGEGGVSTEPPAPVSQSGLDTSSATNVPAWSSRDVENFEKKLRDAGMTTSEQREELARSQSQPSPTEQSPFARELSPGTLRTILDRGHEITLSPEAQELIESLNSMIGAVDIVEGLSKWAITTGDKRVAKLLTEKGPQIVQTLTEDPNKAFETVTAWTEQKTQAFSDKLKAAGMLTAEQQDKLQKAVNTNGSSEKATPNSTSQASGT